MTKCLCQTCCEKRLREEISLDIFSLDNFRYACEICGNKRCPHHEWHIYECTGSNESGQIGKIKENTMEKKGV
jgi:hypothetical protein